MIHDLCRLALLGLALTACAGDKTTTDTGADTDTDTTPTTGMCALSCADYCTTYLGACSLDANNSYADQADCETKCAAFPCGTAEDVAGDTLGCRAYHAGVAAGTGTTVAATHCPHAAENPTDICL